MCYKNTPTCPSCESPIRRYSERIECKQQHLGGYRYMPEERFIASYIPCSRKLCLEKHVAALEDGEQRHAAEVRANREGGYWDTVIWPAYVGKWPWNQYAECGIVFEIAAPIMWLRRVAASNLFLVFYSKSCSEVSNLSVNHTVTITQRLRFEYIWEIGECNSASDDLSIRFFD